MKVLKAVFADSCVKVTVVYLRDAEEKKYREKLSNKKLKDTEPSTIPKIELLGDSHTRDLGRLIKQQNPNKETLVTVKPGATTKMLCERLNAYTAHLTPEDVLFIMSGTNDIKKRNREIISNYYENEREDIISQGGHTNICMISIPNRYDNEHYNGHINTYNAWLKNYCLQHQVMFLNVNEDLNKEDYTRDGLHLNENGKLKLATIISQRANSIINQWNESFP